MAQLQELGFKVTLEAAAAATARISENVPPSKLGLTPSGLGLPVVAQRLSPRGDISPQVDARVLAERCRRDPGPTVWVPSLSDRELRERLNRRAHLIRLRTATRNRVFGALTQWGGCVYPCGRCTPRSNGAAQAARPPPAGGESYSH